MYMACVMAKEAGLWAVTDAEGRFSLKDLPAGQITIVVSFLGFEDWQKKLNLTEDISGYIIRLNAYLLDF